MSASIERYLNNRADLASRKLISGPLDGIGQVIVIPILAERETIETTLSSLAENPQDMLDDTLVIAVVNNRASDKVDQAAIEDNWKTLALLDDLVRGRGAGPPARLRMAYVDAATRGQELGPKEGVGDARKLGLDWGLEVLRRAKAAKGLLINLDADTHVEPNYLKAVRGHFDRSDAWGAVIDFAHRFEGPIEQDSAIVSYELFLRYHILGLQRAASPYAFHTIGSTIVCSAHAYAAAGGMKRRQAGEDFYFVQELAKTGRVDQIRTTAVHPSPRPSWRAPFGTGRRVQQFLSASHEEYRVYHPDSYEVLRGWLRSVADQPQADAESLMEEAHIIAPQLAAFLDAQGFVSIWPKLREHSSGPEGFARQFHRWFDAFTTLRLIHHLRDNGLPEQNTFEAIATLLTRSGGGALDPGEVHGDLDQQKRLLRRLADLERIDRLPTARPPA